MATIKQVAKRANVSVGTVSNVLSDSPQVNPLLRARVLAAIRELDYHPDQVARSLKVRQTKMLGMIISDITNPFFPQLIRGAEDAALAHGYLLVTFNTDDRVEREKQALSVLRGRRVDGVLLIVAPAKGDNTHIKATMAAGVPIVCLDRLPHGIQVDSVSTDHIKGAQVCVRHLLSQGHRRIAMITGSMELQTAQDRLEGYKAALKEARLKIDPEMLREGDFRLEAGHRLTKDLLLQRVRPTALFVSNGMMALGAIKALEETQLSCPKDIAIAVFDDLPLAGVYRPYLTSVAQPTHEI
ncbi:MAG: LacI family transcriptional regulator, partial [Acidobacteria bacterium]|nr:LacI family transcriptional regulator [Acidobacteriota bacterium]